jgi:hypothetical protein
LGKGDVAAPSEIPEDHRPALNSFLPDCDLVAYDEDFAEMMEVVYWEGLATIVHAYLVFICTDEIKQIYERVGCLTIRGTSHPFYAQLGKERVLTVVKTLVRRRCK